MEILFESGRLTDLACWLFIGLVSLILAFIIWRMDPDEIREEKRAMRLEAEGLHVHLELGFMHHHEGGDVPHTHAHRHEPV